MGIQRSQEDAWTKEMAQWEHRPVMIGGKNGTYVEPIPYADGGKGGMPFTGYPKGMYRAEPGNGGYQIAGYKTVGSEADEAVAKGQGWHPSQEEAIAGAAARQRELAELAGNRANTERWMSPAAKAEAQRVDESTMHHVPVIPETPIRKGSNK
jgi:hypothetical protein